MDIALGKKLNYLSETKDLIKAALIEKGQAVSDTDTFRSYADKVLAIETGGGYVEGVHYVTFMSHDGATELYKRPVADGDDCADPVARGLISAPTKESTEQYDYAFVGWATTPNGAWDSNALKAVTEDKTVYAAYASAARYYTITFYDSDGTTVLATKSVAYGSTPSYTPTKEGFVFDHWVPDLSIVTGNASYTAVWASALASGVFSSGAMWTLMPSGEMIFYGDGATDTFGSSNLAPWEAHKGDIKSVVVMEGITEIGGRSFQDCTAISKVTLPASLTKIGTNAFDGCTALTDITLPNSLTNVGNYSFDGCTSLSKITIPANLNSGGTNVFRGCTALTDVTLQNGLTNILSLMFSNCTAITKIVIPASVIKIGRSAFSGCTKLGSVTFEAADGVWEIKDPFGEVINQVTVENAASNATMLRSDDYKGTWNKI